LRDGEIFLHVPDLLHPDQRRAHPRRGTHELDGTLGVGVESEHLSQDLGQPVRQAALQDRRTAQYIDPKRLRGFMAKLWGS
jgi:hypothetical protein